MRTVIPGLELSAVSELVRPPEPIASVYLGLRPPNPTLDPAEDLDLRLRSIVDGLAGQGADAATIDTITAVLAPLDVAPTEFAVFAHAGEILLARSIPGVSRFDRARFASPADVVPLLGWLRRHPAYVSVVTDRTGADVTAVPAGSVGGRTTAVVGPDDVIERNAPGGWAQPRYQRRAEDSWRHNAAAVADAVTHALRAVDAGLLLVAGDVRAVQLLREHLLSAIQHRVTIRPVPGGRRPDGSAQARLAATAAAVDGYAADATTALLDRFTDREPARTVEGVGATLAALAAGEVETLFVADDPDDDRVAWFGPGVLCAATAHEVPAGSGRRPGRLVDVAVRAALLTDAQVHVVDVATGRFVDGVGGLRRFRGVGQPPR